jgi:hypothetical protein
LGPFAHAFYRYFGVGIGGRRGGGVGDALRVKNVTLVVLPTKRGIKKRKEKECPS